MAQRRDLPPRPLDRIVIRLVGGGVTAGIGVSPRTVRTADGLALALVVSAIVVLLGSTIGDLGVNTARAQGFLGWGDNWDSYPEDVDPYTFHTRRDYRAPEQERGFRAATQGPVSADGETDPVREYWHGFFRTNFRSRFLNSAEDYDIVTVLGATFGDPSREGMDEVTAAILLSSVFNLNNNAGGLAAPLPSPADARGDPVYFEARYAWVRIKDVIAKDMHVMLGRIELEDFVGPTYDGINLQFDFEPQVSLQLFGGAPFYSYEERRGDDWMAGLRFQWRPMNQWRMEYDFVYLRDYDPQLGLRDDLFQAIRWWFASDVFLAEFEYQMRDDKARQLDLYMLYYNPDAEVELQGRVIWWFETERGVAPAASFFYSLAFPENQLAEFPSFATTVHPYWHFLLKAAKLFGREWRLEAGMNLRVLEQGRDRSVFNHDWVQLYFKVEADSPFGVKGLFATAEFGYYVAEGWNESINAGGEIGWQIPKKFRVSAGTRYDMYVFDLLIPQEDEDVQTWFLGVDWRPTDWMRLQLRGEYATTNAGDLWAARLGLIFSF